MEIAIKTYFWQVVLIVASEILPFDIFVDVKHVFKFNFFAPAAQFFLHHLIIHLALFYFDIFCPPSVLFGDLWCDADADADADANAGADAEA